MLGEDASPPNRTQEAVNIELGERGYIYTGGLGKFVPSLASGLIAGGWENIRTKILDSPQEVRFVSGSAWGVKPFNIIKS